MQQRGMQLHLGIILGQSKRACLGICQSHRANLKRTILNSEITGKRQDISCKYVQCI